MIRLLLSFLLLASLLHATTITSQHANYQGDQTLKFDVTDMSGDKDWIGIYPVGTSNAWSNVVDWRWVQNRDTITIPSLNDGQYEARVFFHNSFNTEASTIFSVGVVQGATIKTTKTNYNNGESITVSFSNLEGNYEDWVAIYPKNSSNAWGNVLAWKYTKGVKNGSINLGKIQAGDYEARVFFNNSYTLENAYTFSVHAAAQDAAISTDKTEYKTNESVTVNFSNLAGNYEDWVAIYPNNSSNAWGNVLAWKYTKGVKNGSIDLGSLVAGSYQARVFFNNSYTVEAVSNFSVKANAGGGDDNAKIFIIGDSTVHNNSQGEMGWGSALGSKMKHPNNVFNRARSGASSKSYKNNSNGHHDWTTTKSMMQNADILHGAYLFIQFGHNDEKHGYRYTEPGRNNSYYNELKVFTDKARDLGFTPVLITPVSRQYVGSRTHGQYPQTMKDLAADENILLLDLEYKSYLEFKKYDSDAALQAVFHYDDGTHFNPTGAGIVAGWVKELACQKDQTLCSQFK